MRSSSWAFWSLASMALLAALPLQAQTNNKGMAETAADRTLSAPLSSNSTTTVDADYRIAPNDLMEFDVFGVPDMRRDVRVNTSGQVSLPLIGQVPVAGLTPQAAQQLIAARYEEKYLMNPQVSLFIKEFTTKRVAIEGAVIRPGIYPMTGDLTLLRALALAGGFAPYADLKQIVVYRNGKGSQREQFSYDLDQVRSGKVNDPDIRSDDVIVIQRDPRRAALKDSLFSDILDTLNPFK